MRPAAAAIALLTAVAAHATPCRAQSPAEAHRLACLDSIPASALAPTVAYLVSTDPDSTLPGHAALRTSIDLFTQTVSLQLRRLLDTSTVQLPSAASLLGWRDIGRHVTVVWRLDGGTSWRESADSGIQVATGHRGTTLLIRALEAARGGGKVNTGADALLADSISFELGYRTPSRDRDGHLADLTLRLGFPVFTLLAPWERHVSMTSRAAPRYPVAWRQRGYEAVLQVEYLVDEEGRADPANLRDGVPKERRPTDDEASQAYADFIAAVRGALPHWRFEPALVAGCRVPEQVRQSFAFRIGR